MTILSLAIARDFFGISFIFDLPYLVRVEVD